MNFLTKSIETREQDLFEAYQKIKTYRENLAKLKQVDLIITPDDHMEIINELYSLDNWLTLHARTMKIQFEEV
jgi:hypothetical protein